MFTIGEFSKITGLPVKTLRFYHEKNVLVPSHVEEGTGYRYYNAANVEKANVIVRLRGLDFSLNEIREILENHDDEADILEHLQRQKERIAERLRRSESIVELLDRIIAAEQGARNSLVDSGFSVQRQSIDSMLIAGVRMKGKYSDCGKAFATLGRHFGRFLCGKPFCLYFDGEYREDDADLEACFPVRKGKDVDGISVRELEGTDCMTLFHKGPYDQLGRSYVRILDSVKQSRLRIELPTREVYHKGPGMIFRGNPNRYLTEIQIPVGT